MASCSGTNLTPKEEAPFDQWIFQVKGTCISHRPEAIRSGIVNSVRGDARELIGNFGFDASLDVIIADGGRGRIKTGVLIGFRRNSINSSRRKVRKFSNLQHG